MSILLKFRNLLSALLIVTVSLNAAAQKMQATLKVGNNAHTVDVYLKSSASFSQKDEAMTFVIAIPANLKTVPTIGSSGVTTNSKGAVTGIAGLIPSFLINELGSTTREVLVTTQEIYKSTYYLYTFIFAGTGAANHRWIAGEEQKIFSVQFNSSTADFNPSSALLVNLADGGSKASAYFYFQANTLGDITNVKAPFYKNEQTKDPVNGGSYSSLSAIGFPAKQSSVVESSVVAIKTEVVVYPSITSGPVSVRLPLDFENATISILNASGKEVTSDISKSVNRSFNLNGFAGGTYFVKVINKGNVVSTDKVVLQK